MDLFDKVLMKKQIPARKSGTGTEKVVSRKAKIATRSEASPVGGVNFHVQQKKKENDPIQGKAEELLKKAQVSVRQHKKDKNEPVLQGKFEGTYGAILTKLTPANLGLHASLYSTLWDPLCESETVLKVEHGSGAYEQATHTMTLPEGLLMDLFNHVTKKKELAPDVLVSHVATLSHELSHAKDHIVKGREVRPKSAGADKHTEDVLDTELRAWAHEAIIAFQAGIVIKGMDAEKKKLVDGWLGIEKDNLQNVQESKAGNEVVARLFRYISRGISAGDASETIAWAKEHADWIWGKVSGLKVQLEAKLTVKPVRVSEHKE
jgi:hypothetical protein